MEKTSPLQKSQMSRHTPESEQVQNEDDAMIEDDEPDMDLVGEFSYPHCDKPGSFSEKSLLSTLIVSPLPDEGELFGGFFIRTII